MIKTSTEIVRAFLTYKSKVLLVFQGTVSHESLSEVWDFIECKKELHLSREQSIIARIKTDIGITLNKVELLSDFVELSEVYYYKGQLSDRNVNEITRRDHQLVNFFSAKEVDSLVLGASAHSFWQRNKVSFSESAFL